MGLSIYSKNFTASWSYMGFSNFRSALAKEIGVELSEMCGFGGSKSWDDVHSPLVALLNHSDCDGTLLSGTCKLMVPELKKIMDTWWKQRESIRDEYNIQELGKLIRAMEECADSGEELKFA